MTTTQTTIEEVLARWVGRSQRSATVTALRGEEGAGMRETLRRVARSIDETPETYAQSEMGDDAVVHLHFFRGSADVWITEKDVGAPDDTSEEFQSQMFGLVDFGHGAELGYVSLSEIRSAGLELDYHWTPTTVGEIRERIAR